MPYYGSIVVTRQKKKPVARYDRLSLMR